MLVDQERLTISQTARRVGVSVPTIWRWILGGVKGRRLPSVRIGGRRWILATDLERFTDSDNAETSDSTSPPRSMANRAESAARELESRGVR